MLVTPSIRAAAVAAAVAYVNEPIKIPPIACLFSNEKVFLTIYAYFVCNSFEPPAAAKTKYDFAPKCSGALRPFSLVLVHKASSYETFRCKFPILFNEYVHTAASWYDTNGHSKNAVNVLS